MGKGILRGSPKSGRWSAFEASCQILRRKCLNHWEFTKIGVPRIYPKMRDNPFKGTPKKGTPIVGKPHFNLGQYQPQPPGCCPPQKPQYLNAVPRSTIISAFNHCWAQILAQEIKPDGVDAHVQQPHGCVPQELGLRQKNAAEVARKQKGCLRV